jgi:hypothetical protein
MTPERLIELKHLAEPVEVHMDGGRLKECLGEIERLQAENTRLADKNEAMQIDRTCMVAALLACKTCRELFKNGLVDRSALRNLLAPVVDLLKCSKREIEDLMDKIRKGESSGWEGERRRCLLLQRLEQELAYLQSIVK